MFNSLVIPLLGLVIYVAYKKFTKKKKKFHAPPTHQLPS